MGLGKHFYTHKNEGNKLSVREEEFFGIRKPKQPSPKKKVVKQPKSESIADMIKGLFDCH